MVTPIVVQGGIMSFRHKSSAEIASLFNRFQKPFERDFLQGEQSTYSNKLADFSERIGKFSDYKVLTECVTIVRK